MMDLKMLVIGLTVAVTAVLSPPVFAGDSPVSKGVVTLCHQPGTQAQKTLVLPSSAAKGHMKHGDMASACGVPRASAIIGPTGGQISIPGFGSVIFPSGVFSNTQQVELAATSMAETAQDFNDSAFMFDAGVRTPYELRINTGMVKPQTGFKAVINVSTDFLAQVPAGSEIQVFAQIFQDGGEEVLDHFELFESTYSSASGTVTVNLPPEAFTNRRHADQTYEAIILLATTPTKPDTTSVLQHQSLGINAEQALPPPAAAIIEPANLNVIVQTVAAATACQGSSLGSPIDNRQVTSPFNGSTHYGTDYKAADGTQYALWQTAQLNVSASMKDPYRYLTLAPVKW